MFKQQGKFHLLQSSNFCLNQIRLFAKVFKKSEKEKGKKIRKREKAPGAEFSPRPNPAHGPIPLHPESAPFPSPPAADERTPHVIPPRRLR
jgi:hypothetical protein